MLSNRILAALVAVVAVSAGLAFATPAAQAQAMSQVRAVNMTPGLGPAEVLLDGAPVINGLAFRDATGYAPVPPGRHTVTLRHGAPRAAEVQAIVDFEPGRYRTLICTLTDDQIVPLSLDDETEPAPPGQAKIRFVHTAPDVPAVDVAVQGGPVLFSGIDFRGTSSYTNVPAGTYTLALNRAGATDTLLTVPGVALASGQVLTVFGAGTIAAGNVQAVPLEYPAAVTGAAVATLPSAGTGFFADSGPAAGLAVMTGIVGLALLAALLLRRRPVVTLAGDGSTWDSWGSRVHRAPASPPTPTCYQMPLLAPYWQTRPRPRTGLARLAVLPRSLMLALLGLLAAVAGLVFTRLKRTPRRHRGW